MSLVKFVAVAAVMLTAAASTASAATCSAAVADALTPNSGCYLGSGNDSAGDLRADGVFGATDYVLLAKDDGLNGTDEGDSSLLTVTGDDQSGTISIAQSVFDMYGAVSIVLKGPSSQNSTPADSFVAYLVESTGPFTYLSPYFNENGSRQDLSHVSLYAGNPDTTPVPLPATVVLLAGALGGLGALRRRKAKTA